MVEEAYEDGFVWRLSLALYADVEHSNRRLRTFWAHGGIWNNVHFMTFTETGDVHFSTI
jgi:hypothetical protein